MGEADDGALGGTIALDVVFAILPWILVWKLNKPISKKIFIAGSLSLGLVSAVLGIERLLSLANSPNGATTPQLVVFTMAEITATLVCVGIPASLQVYRAWWAKVFGSGWSSQQDTAGGSQPLANYTIGGSEMPGMMPSATNGGQVPSRKRRRTRSTVKLSQYDGTLMTQPGTDIEAVADIDVDMDVEVEVEVEEKDGSDEDGQSQRRLK